MKPKFQVGDHVVVKHQGFESGYNWKKGIVTKTERIDNQRFYKVEFDADCCPPLYFTARELERDTAWYWYKSQSKNKHPKTKLEHVKSDKKIQYKFKVGDHLRVIENCCSKAEGKVVKVGYYPDIYTKWYILKQNNGEFSPKLCEVCLELVEEQPDTKFKVGDIAIVKDCGFLDGCAGIVKRISTLDSGEMVYETAIGMPNGIKSVIKLREKDLRAPKYNVGYQVWGVKITDIGYVYDARHSFRDRKPAVVYTLSMSDGTVRHTIFEDRVSDEIVEYQKRLDRWCRENVERLLNPFSQL